MIYNIILVLLFSKNRAMISALKNDGERRIFKGKGGIVDEKTILHGFVFGDAVRGVCLRWYDGKRLQSV